MTLEEIKRNKYLKIIEISRFLIETKANNSEIQEKFNISNKTLSDYLNKNLKEYAEVDNDSLAKELYEIVQNIQKEKMSKSHSELNCEDIGNYIVKNYTTIQVTAMHFGLSVRTIKNYINKELIKKNLDLYNDVKKVQSEVGIYCNIVGGKNGIREKKRREFEGLEIAEDMLVNSYSLNDASRKYNIPISTLYELIRSIKDEELQKKLDDLFNLNNTERFGANSLH